MKPYLPVATILLAWGASWRGSGWGNNYYHINAPVTHCLSDVLWRIAIIYSFITSRILTTHHRIMTIRYMIILYNHLTYLFAKEDIMCLCIIRDSLDNNLCSFLIRVFMQCSFFKLKPLQFYESCLYLMKRWKITLK